MLARITDRYEDTSYIVRSAYDCKDNVDASAYRIACQHGLPISLGIICVEILEQGWYENFTYTDLETV